ncbi:MAG: IS110 family transposase, partial [Pseudomonadota bacterium]|nr:IS110 family transposase [Pseudomonadota bacterium]
MKKSKSRGAQRERKRISGHLEQVNLYAAGIDIGSRSHFVAVPAELAEQPVREYACFTGDLQRLADWLVEIGIRTVAMESTGVYWIPVFEVLEERGLEVLLVNARHVKNVPGRKSDVQDCQWLQQLHTYGLLRGAFRPPEESVALRAYLRQREVLVRRASDHIRHMQKALRQMNLLLDNVVSDITGVTGMAIIRAIVGGERDARVLAKLRDKRCRHGAKTIAASLEGHYREEHLFALRQAVELYDFYQRQIAACDAAIEQQLQGMDSTGGSRGDLPPSGKRKSKSSPGFDVRGEIYRITGVDPTQIEGMNENTVLK